MLQSYVGGGIAGLSDSEKAGRWTLDAGYQPQRTLLGFSHFSPYLTCPAHTPYNTWSFGRCPGSPARRINSDPGPGTLARNRGPLSVVPSLNHPSPSCRSIHRLHEKTPSATYSGLARPAKRAVLGTCTVRNISRRPTRLYFKGAWSS